MEDKEATSPPNPSLESNGKFDEKTKAIDEDSKHVSRIFHQFYFVKLWPTDPDSITKIKKEENVLMKLNQDICEVTEKITEKMSQREYLDSMLNRLHYLQKERRNRVASKEKILRDLYMALDELNFMNKASKGGRFGEKPDKNSMNSVMLHSCKNLAEEKKILRDINIQQKGVASFKSLKVLKKTIRWSFYLKNWQKLLREIEQFQIQYMERASGNDPVKENISNYESLKKIIKDQIKLLFDESFENRREWKECGTKVRHGVKELEAINGELYSLKAKLTENHKKKGEAYQRILKLKNLHHEEILQYYQHCSLINKVHQLAEEKDVSTLDEMSNSEVGKFMLEWNNNKTFREDYEKKVRQSLERRQLSRDGRRKPINHGILCYCNGGREKCEDCKV